MQELLVLVMQFMIFLLKIPEKTDKEGGIW